MQRDDIPFDTCRTIYLLKPLVHILLRDSSSLPCTVKYSQKSAFAFLCEVHFVVISLFRMSTSAVCCSVLQCVAVCCSVLQCFAMCCNVLQCVAGAVCRSVLQCGAGAV